MITHKIVKGDTLWELSRSYGCTVNEIVQLNGIKNPNSVKIGTVILIPTDPDYATIGKLFLAALNDLEGLPNVEKLLEMVKDE